MKKISFFFFVFLMAQNTNAFECAGEGVSKVSYISNIKKGKISYCQKSINGELVKHGPFQMRDLSGKILVNKNYRNGVEVALDYKDKNERKGEVPIPVRRTIELLAANTAENTRPIGAISFSDDEELIAASIRNEKIVIWKTSSGKKLREIKIPNIDEKGRNIQGGIKLAFSRDGKYLASGYKNGIVLIYNQSTGELVKNIKISTRKKKVGNIRFAHDHLVVKTGRIMTFFQLKNWKQLFQIEDEFHNFKALTVDSKKKVVITFENHQQVTVIHDLNTGNLIKKTKLTKNKINKINGFPSPRGKYISLLYAQDDGKAKQLEEAPKKIFLYSLMDRELLLETEKLEQGEIRNIFSLDEKYMAIVLTSLFVKSKKDDLVYIYDLTNFKKIFEKQIYLHNFGAKYDLSSKGTFFAYINEANNIILEQLK